jgi:hypothetical protein
MDPRNGLTTKNTAAATPLKRVLFACLLSGFLSTGLQASTLTATSCAAADVQTAINASNNGDTVLIPGNTCGTGSGQSWNSTVTISSSHQITLNGQGAVITFGSGGHINVVTGASNSTRITGFTIKQGASPNINVTVTSSSLPYQIDHNTFTDDGTQGATTFIQLNGYGAGVVTNNSFTTTNGADQMITVWGCTGPSDYTCLGKDVLPGSGGMHYIENNTFTYNAYASPSNSGPPYYFWGTQAMNTYYAAVFVFRYNTMSMVGLEMHGRAPNSCSGYGGENSTRWYEVYDNNFTIPRPQSNQSFYIHPRGGSGVIFDNQVTNPTNNTSTGGINLDEDCGSGTWPLQAQIGRGLNTAATSTGTTGHYSPAYSWGQDPSTFPLSTVNSAFVLFGASPTDATHCSGHAGNVCDEVNTASKPSTLQRCEAAADVAAGCPVSYSYSPYTYPYPLTTTSAGDPTPPSGLTAVVQ